MDERVLLPAEGLQETQPQPGSNPWLERDRRGRFKGSKTSEEYWPSLKSLTTVTGVSSSRLPSPLVSRIYFREELSVSS